MKVDAGTRFPREAAMRAPVQSWLLDRDFLPAVEFWLHWGGITDIVAGLYAPRKGRRIPTLLEVAAVELKLHDVAGVIKQATHNRYVCDWSYAAMPVERVMKMRPGTLDKFAECGVGLLAVGDTITDVVPPRRGDGLPSDRSQVKQLWRRVRGLSASVEPITQPPE